MLDMIVSLRVIELAVRQMQKGCSAFLRLLVVLLCACSAIALHAQQDVNLTADTLDIRFRLDSIKIDMGFAANAAHWQTFLNRFEAHARTRQSSRMLIDIYSGASPEGTAVHNRWLGEQRGQAVRRLLRQQLGNQVGSIIVHNEAARWDGFYDLVAASQEPWRDEVLRIIEMPASTDETQWDHRELKLRALQGGKVWPILLEKYLAPLRSGATAIVRWNATIDTVVVRDTIVMVCDPKYPRGAVYADKSGALYRLPDSTRVRKPADRKPIWILRSNLPLLGTGTPNLQAEYPLGSHDRWSINVEGIWSWWTFSHNKFANQILYGSAELRHWLGRRERHDFLSGWHLGLAVGAGYGDLEWKSRGFQAEVFSAFVNIGWQRRFGKRKQWAFDAGIGLGYAHIPWRRYTGSRIFPKGHEERYDDHLMWRETGRNNWLGTPHLNISLGYVFPIHKKTGK